MAGPATLDGQGGSSERQTVALVDAAEIYASDAFRMTAFKTLLCSNRQPHDWKRCPFAHPGEHARRRPLDKYSYCAEMCPHARHSLPCPRGDTCPFSHHVFEMWLHPDRYKTTLCVDGAACKRRVCFFAHTVGELRTPSFGGGGVDHAAAAQQLAQLSSSPAAGLGQGIDSGAPGGQPLLRRAPCVVPAPQSSGNGGDSSRGAGSPVPASHHVLQLPSQALATATAAPSVSAAALKTAMQQGGAAATPAGYPALGQAGSTAASPAAAIGVTPAGDGVQAGMLGSGLLSQAQGAAAGDARLAPACPAAPGLGPGLLPDAVVVSAAADAGFMLPAAFSGAASGPLLSMQEQGTYGLGPQSLSTWEVVSLSAPLLQHLPPQAQQLQQLPLPQVQQMPLRVASLNAQPANTCMMLPLLSGGSVHVSATAGGGWPGALAAPSAAGSTLLVYTAAPMALQQFPPQQLQAAAGAPPMVIYTQPPAGHHQ